MTLPVRDSKVPVSLAQRSSALGFDLRMVTDSFMMGMGSTPVSAMRPANTETILGVLGESAAATVFT